MFLERFVCVGMSGCVCACAECVVKKQSSEIK